MNSKEADAIQQIAEIIQAIATTEGTGEKSRKSDIGTDSVFTFRNDFLPLLRNEVSKRNLRRKYFPSELFSEPGWNILLDMYDSLLRDRAVCVTDACIASQSPPTTALRWLQRLEELGLVERRPSTSDSRVTYLSLSEQAVQSLREYFEVLKARQ